MLTLLTHEIVSYPSDHSGVFSETHKLGVRNLLQTAIDHKSSVPSTCVGSPLVLKSFSRARYIQCILLKEMFMKAYFETNLLLLL